MTGSAVAELVVEHASTTGPRQSGHGTEIVVRRSGSTVTDHDGCGPTGLPQIANNPVPGLHALPRNGSLCGRGRGVGVRHALHDALDAVPSHPYRPRTHYALMTDSARTRPARAAKLMLVTPEQQISAREAEILAALGERLTNAEIAARFHIGVRTVESHVSALLRKLGAADRRELAALEATARRPPARF